MDILLDSGWKFSFPGKQAEEVTLPHDAMISEKRSATCAGGKQNAYFPGGKYRYERKLNIKKEDLGKEISLLFEGVYRNAEVFLNGEKAGEHAYGYTEFYVSLTGKVKEGENELVVTADNSLLPNCRWYTGGGIYRPVHLIIRGKDAPEYVKVSTISHSPAVIKVETNEGAGVEIFKEGELVASGSAGEFVLQNARLWSAEDPFLYTCTVTRGGEKLSVKFGVRTVSVSSSGGLLINGKRVLLRGGCIHHDNGILGACSYPDAEERRVRILKECGFNALRISHNPASRALLDACDKLGMYVLDEAFDGWYIPKDYHDYSRDFMKHYKEDLTAMAEKDFSRPSVIMYSVGNEVTESAEERGVKLMGEMRDILHSLDPTRPVTCGINVLLDVYVRHGLGVYKDKGEYVKAPLERVKGYKEKRSGSAFFNYWAQKLGKLMFFMSKGKTADKVLDAISPAIDIVGLNYASSRYDKDAALRPERIMLGTETMAGDLPYNWERVKKYPQLLGDFVWAAWDYIGEACIGDWTYYSYKGLPLLAGQGMADITGFPKAQMHFMRTVWGMEKNPYLCVRPLNHSGECPKKGAWQFTDAIASWTWHGYEGKRTIAEVYSNAYAVRLERDGKVLGTRKVKANKALFKVTYRPGTLTAVALDESGNEVGRCELKTGGRGEKITVKTEKTRLRSGEICFAELMFTDENGEVLPYKEESIKIEVKGSAAKLKGFGSALCKTDETFTSNIHTAYRGRALVAFIGGERGKSEITVSAKGLAPVTFTIEVI